MAIPHENGQLTRPRAAVGMTAVAQPVVRYFVQLQFSGVWSGWACICVSIPQDWGLSQVLMLEISKCPEVSNNLEAVAIWGCKMVVCTGVAVWVSKSCLRFLMYPKQLRENRKITGICLWNTSCGSRNLMCRKTDSLFVTLGTSSSECTVTTWSTGSKLCTAAKKRRVIWVNLQQLHDQKKVNGSVNITRVARDKFQSCFFGPENSTGASDDPSMAVRLCRELVDTDDSGEKMRCHVISCHVHGDCANQCCQRIRLLAVTHIASTTSTTQSSYCSKNGRAVSIATHGIPYQPPTLTCAMVKQCIYYEDLWGMVIPPLRIPHDEPSPCVGRIITHHPPLG